MKLKLDTIILYLQNVEKLKSFYTGILKLDIVEEYEATWVLLKAGNGNVGLHKIGDQYLDNSKEAFRSDSNAKIVFEVDEDIHKIREYLLRQAVAMREIKTFEDYDYWLCDGEDPEGNVFQIKQKKK